MRDPRSRDDDLGVTMKDLAFHAAVTTVVFGPGALGTIMWWITGNLEWLWAWVLTGIILMAG